MTLKNAIIVAAVSMLFAGSTAMAQIVQSPEIAAKIQEMGTELSRELVGGTMHIYAPLHAGASKDGYEVMAD